MRAYAGMFLLLSMKFYRACLKISQSKYLIGASAGFFSVCCISNNIECMSLAFLMCAAKNLGARNVMLQYARYDTWVCAGTILEHAPCISRSLVVSQLCILYICMCGSNSWNFLIFFVKPSISGNSIYSRAIYS